VLACLLFAISFLSALDLNDTESIEEGKVSGYQEEDQGQANQGKPSKHVAYLIPILLIYYCYENALFSVAIASK
jgi:hypothetical protein